MALANSQDLLFILRARDLTQAGVRAMGNNLKTLGRQVTLLTKQANSMFRGFRQGWQRARRDFQAASREFGRLRAQVFNLRNALLGLGLGLAARRFTDMADSMTLMRSRLGLFVTEGEDANRVFEDLFNASQRTRSSFEGTVELFTRVAQARSEIGLSANEMIRFSENIQKLTVISGASAQEARNAVIQLAQGLSSGQLRGEELRAVMEQLPAVARTIADQIGISVGKFRELAFEGRITGEVVTQAILLASDDIREAFENMPTTVGQQMTRLQNILVATIGQETTREGSMGRLVERVSEFETLLKSPAFRQAINIFAEGLVQAANAMARAFIWATENADKLKIALAGIATLLVVRTVANIAKAFFLLGRAILAAAGAAVIFTLRSRVMWKAILVGLALMGVLEKHWDRITDAAKRAEEALDDMGLNIRRFFLGDINNLIDAMEDGEKATEDMTDVVGIQDDALRDLQRQLDSTVDVVKLLERAQKQGADAVDEYTDSMVFLQEAVRRGKIEEEQMTRTLEDLQEEYFGVDTTVRDLTRSIEDVERAQRLNIITNEQAQRVLRDYNLELLRTQAEQTRSFGAGARLAVAEYYDEISNGATSAANLVGSSLRSVRDSLSNFFQTGKFEATDFFDSIKKAAADFLADRAIQLILGLLFGGGGGGGGTGFLGGLGNLLGSVFSGGGGGGGGGGAGGAGGGVGGIVGQLLGPLKGIFSGGGGGGIPGLNQIFSGITSIFGGGGGGVAGGIDAAVNAGLAGGAGNLGGLLNFLPGAGFAAVGGLILNDILSGKNDWKFDQLALQQLEAAAFQGKDAAIAHAKKTDIAWVQARILLGQIQGGKGTYQTQNPIVAANLMAALPEMKRIYDEYQAEVRRQYNQQAGGDGGGAGGYQFGGAFQVPGVGHPDSRQVSFQATGGESVRITTRGQDDDLMRAIQGREDGDESRAEVMERLLGLVILELQRIRTAQVLREDLETPTAGSRTA